MIVFYNISQLMSLKRAVKKQGRNIVAKDLSLIKKPAMIVDNGYIRWVGPESDLPSSGKKVKRKSLKGLNVFPGFIDPHTHLVFAGHRKKEFEMRNRGISYQKIAQKGGGILSTVSATRKANFKKLILSAQKRVAKSLKQGVTTIEIKSGYGLDQKTEEKILTVAGALKKANIVTSFLGAHALPPEQAGKPTYKKTKKNTPSEKNTPSNEDQTTGSTTGFNEKPSSREILYLNELKKNLLRIKKLNLSRRVDIFIEKNYFSLQGAKDYLLTAKKLGFDLCIHADQLSRSGGVALGVELGAFSVDHGVYMSQEDLHKLARSQTVAVLLPTADFYLQTPYPPARPLIDSGACVALATDFNPGSAPSQSLGLVGVLARVQMKMSLPEVFSAFTVGASKALGLEGKAGALLEGHRADFFTSPAPWKDFFHDPGTHPVSEVFVRGKKVL